MSEITVSKQAKQDLIDIWSYIADDNPQAADTVLDTLNKKISLLADHPLLGPARLHIARDLRYLISGNYLILYRVIKENVEIVRVLHGARNLSALFKDDETSHRTPRPRGDHPGLGQQTDGSPHRLHGDLEIQRHHDQMALT